MTSKIADPSHDATRPGVSEAASKKRGRPPRFTAAELKVARWVKQDARSERTAQGTTMALRAMHALKDAAPSWFFSGQDQKRLAAEGRDVIRWSVLEALGRIGNPERTRDVARQLAELPRMNAKEAVRIIRAMEGTDKQTPGTVEGAAEALRAALNNYMTAHPMDWDDAITAIDILAMAVRDAQESEVTP